ncbi:DsbA family oxidoreductase [Ralstonia sp.]|uniref:DsbA family oxidoreductase n=1 Tax=Ralstonia sp. TaxID=54061 RepID=UPI0031D972AC
MSRSDLLPLEGDSIPYDRQTLVVDVSFDFICPWSMVGKRSLRLAIQRLEKIRPDVSVEVRWHGRPVLPNTPPGGLPYHTLYLTRTGSRTAAAARRMQVEKAGEALGVFFDFSRIRILPNTDAAHRLVEHVARHGTRMCAELLIDRIFKAYFIDAENIGCTTVLRRLAADFGVGAAVAESLLDMAAVHPGHSKSPRGRPRKPGGIAAVSEVPFFLFNRTTALSGAHSYDAMLSAMLAAVPSGCRESAAKAA